MNSETPLTDAKVAAICDRHPLSATNTEWYLRFQELASFTGSLELRYKRLEEALRRVTHDVEELFKLADDCIIYDGDTWSCRSCGMELDSGIGHSSHCLASRITDFGAAIHVAEKALADQQEEKP